MMRKRLVEPSSPAAAPLGENWLDLETLAEVEVTSEDPASPIEHALLPDRGVGWRAAAPGPQTIRLIFDRPQRLTRIWLRFVDSGNERTQEYVLRWYPDRETAPREIVRQQWTFSPGGAGTEVESHAVELPSVAILELSIIPDIAGKPIHASLQALRLA